MTHTEIHALYSPLWEMVPETKPDYQTDFDEHSGGAQRWRAYCWRALCRNAVVEWLCKSVGALDIHRLKNGRFGARLLVVADDFSHTGYGSAFDTYHSLDHALVAVATKVAENARSDARNSTTT